MPMSTSPDNDHRIDYIELPARDLDAVRTFYGTVFGWPFEDYGPDYTAFFDGRLAGGFFRADAAATSGALVVLYATDLEATEQRVRDAGGTITEAIFSFPGGRRFHFADPVGNVLAVWADH